VDEPDRQPNDVRWIFLLRSHAAGARCRPKDSEQEAKMTGLGPRWRTLALATMMLVLGQSAIAQGTPPAAESSPPAAPTPPSVPGANAPTPPPVPQASQMPQSPPAAAPAEPAAWYSVTGQGFTAEMPVAPKYSTTEMRTGTGSLYTVHQYLLEQGDVAYIVQAATYPDDINVASPRVNLQGGLDNLAKGMEGAKWASVDWVTHQGLTAADAVGARSGHAIRSFSVMKGRQVFTLIYAGAPGTARSADVNRFIASLRIAP
jgi:hypothetical protein